MNALFILCCSCFSSEVSHLKRSVVELKTLVKNQHNLQRQVTDLQSQINDLSVQSDMIYTARDRRLVGSRIDGPNQRRTRYSIYDDDINDVPNDVRKMNTSFFVSVNDDGEDTRRKIKSGGYQLTDLDLEEQDGRTRDSDAMASGQYSIGDCNRYYIIQ